jgi:hypothetical protein
VKSCRLTALLAVLSWGAPAAVAAHDIPNDVTIRAFVKAEGQVLRLLVRVPLQAMRDIDYPRRDRDYVDLARVEGALREAAATWVANDVALYEGPTRLATLEVRAVRAAMPSDGSFRSYDAALAHLRSGGQPTGSTFVWNQGVLDVLLEGAIDSDRSSFSIEPRWGRLGLRTLTALRFITPDGSIRAFEFPGDPGLVRLDPGWHQAAGRFVRFGFLHILGGTDHLLFLLCLVIPFRRLRPLVLIVTSFTVAHSITLLASAYDLAPSVLWFPPLIETLIAASIVYMALENIVWASAATASQTGTGARVLITFAFGLVHGFGFSFALKQTLQFAGSHLLLSLVSFNVGVELGQVLVLGLLVPSLTLVFRHLVPERTGSIILSALVAHTGWHWMTERAGRLWQYSFEWPPLTPSVLLDVTRWLMLVVIVSAVAWLVMLRTRHARGARRLESDLNLTDNLDVSKRTS